MLQPHTSIILGYDITYFQQCRKDYKSGHRISKNTGKRHIRNVKKNDKVRKLTEWILKKGYHVSIRTVVLNTFNHKQLYFPKPFNLLCNKFYKFW